MTREEAERLLSLAREARFIGPAAPAWVERLASMREEFVEAARFLTSKGEEEAAADLAANVWRLWFLVGDVAGGRRLLAAALDVGRQPASRSRALALYGDGVLAFRAGEQAESEGRNEQALEVARAVGDREAEALALVGLSRVALRNGDYPRVQSLAATVTRRPLCSSTHKPRWTRPRSCSTLTTPSKSSGYATTCDSSAFFTPRRNRTAVPALKGPCPSR